MGHYFAIEDLAVAFKTFEGEKDVLNLGRLAMEKGETFGLVGESGAGKTVLALAILRLLQTPPGVIRSGKILFDGEDLLRMSEREIRAVRGRRISMIFQDPMSTLNPVFTIGEQLTNVIQHNQQVSHKRACQIADDVILRVKLPEADRILKKYPHELSGGQRQRAIIAIALSCQAEFLIADEPTRNLDVTIQAGILKLMADLRQELNITMLFIANNLGLVSVICNRVGILFNGEIVETGTTGEVLRDPRHPYTLALLEAVTRQRKEANGLHRVDLSVAAGLEPGGCSYAGRCIHKTGLCLKEAPALAEIGGTHLVACHRRMEGGDRQ